MNPPIRVLIADDESAARRRLLQFLQDIPDICVVAECHNGLETCVQIEKLKPDLVFLDVEMPALNGLEVVAQIGTGRMPTTIFATAFNHYALPAFDSNAVDYLLKPFDRQRFERAIEKARIWLNGGHRGADHCQLKAVLEQSGHRLKYPDRLLVRSGESHLLIKTADICFVSAEGNYIRLHMADTSHLKRERMVGIAEKLDPATFCRIHRSHIVNLNHVSKLLPWYGGDQLVIMTNGSKLTLSRNYRDALNAFV